MTAVEKGIHARDIALHRMILRDFGRDLDSGSLILDFGCGCGRLVQKYRDAGFQAFGADIHLPEQHQYLRLIPENCYRIPFDDNTFDFVFSNSVLEHVQDLASALVEIRRVLKPGGASLHFFPPRAKPVEPHVFVPLGGIIRNRLWLLLWAAVGIRNQFQKNLNFRQVAARNYAYLHEHTFYRSKRELRTQIRAEFQNVVFADRQMIRDSNGRAKWLSPFVGVFPFLARLYGGFHNRCIFFEKPKV